MKKILLSLMTPITQSSYLADAILAIPRILCGYFLAVNFGGSKFGVPWSPNGVELGFLEVADWFPGDVAEFGGMFALAPLFFAWIAAASEAIGGMLLLLGLKTRLSAFLISCTMLVAIFFQKWDQGLWGMLPALGFLWVALYSLVLGSGRFGLDYLIAKKWKQIIMAKENAPLQSLSTSIAYKALGLFCILSFTVCTAGPGAKDYQVTFKVDMNQQKEVKEVSIRGNVSPLNWEKDIVLTDEDGDGVFEKTLQFSTPRKRIEYKFLYNGNWELEGSGNRSLRLNADKLTVQHLFNQFDFYSKEQIEELSYTEDQLREDVATLKKTIEYIHPNLHRYRSKEKLDQDFAELEKELIAEPNIQSAFKSVSRFIAKVQCSHTFTNPWNQKADVNQAMFAQPDKVPFTFKRIGTRMFIDKNASSNEALAAGLEIVSINGIQAETILPQLSQYIASDGSNIEKRYQRLTMSGEEKYELFDIFYPLEYGSRDRFKLELKNHQTGDIITTEVMAMTKTNRSQILKKRYPEFTTSIEDGWQFKVLDDQTAYLKISTFAIFGNEFNWRPFLHNVFKELKKKSVEHFIIDIRGNEGGNTEIAEYIMTRLINEPAKVPGSTSYTNYQTIPEELKAHINTWDKRPYDWKKMVTPRSDGKFAMPSEKEMTFKPKKDRFRGKTYLLTDATNSSATHVMATYVKKYQLATIVGQTTGGNQRGFNGGYMFFHTLPNTKIEIDIPVFGIHIFPVNDQTPDGGIEPDVSVEKNVEDFINGVDTELEATFNIIKGKY